MNVMIEAYLDNNIGDDLMIKLLARNFEEDKFFIYTNSSVISRAFSDNKNIIIKDLKRRKGDIKNIDVYLTIGGSLFQITSIKHYLSRILKIIKLIKFRRKGLKIVTLGSNLGPYSKIGKILTKIELSKNDLVTVRDLISKETINSFGNVKNFYFADDIVYNLEVEKEEKKEGLGISVYRSLKKEEKNYENYEVLASITDNYIEKTNKKVMLFAFDSETENDLVAAHYIYKLAKNKNNIDIIPYLGDEKSFLDRFKKCESMIAIRFHSAILSDIYNIPFLPIAYSNKMKNLMRDRKFRGKVINLDDLAFNIDVDNIVDKLITKDGLFNEFLLSKGSAIIHFDEFSNLIRMRKI